MQKISHDGIVDSTEGSDVLVRITSFAACSSCHARGACNVTGEKEKYMRIPSGTAHYAAGDRVRVVLAQSLGFRALFLGYVLPFFLVLFALLISTAAGVTELVSGLISLSVLPPYYIGLKLFGNRLAKQFSFMLQKT